MCKRLKKLIKANLNKRKVKEYLTQSQNIAKNTIFLIEKDVRLKCPYYNCEKKFKIRGNLNIHIKSHTGEREFVCPFPLCGKKFITKGNLDSHINTHTGIKTFRCNINGCKRGYSHRCRLLIHQRTHVISFKADWGKTFQLPTL
jgi:uncharacterized Zn-finger protein